MDPKQYPERAWKRVKCIWTNAGKIGGPAEAFLASKLWMRVCSEKVQSSNTRKI